MPPDALDPDPTEDWARTLLHRAADTIEVEPAGPLDEPPPRRIWPLLAAAAAVIAVATATAAVSLGNDPEPPPVVTPHLDQVPSVFGYDGAGAEAILEAAGLVVTEHPIQTCEPIGRAVETVPPAGSPISAGEEVQVRVSSGDGGLDCLWDVADRTQAWAFIDFANGRGPAPVFADEVRVYLNGDGPLTLTAAEAADPDSWGQSSVIMAIRAASTWVRPAETIPGLTSPMMTLSTSSKSPYGRCGFTQPDAVSGRSPLSLVIDIQSEAFYVGCTVDVALYRTDGAIDTVVAATRTAAESELATSVPSVTGLTPDHARQLLADQFLDATIVPADGGGTCSIQRAITGQDPAPGEVVVRHSTVTLEVAEPDPTCEPGELSTDAKRVAEGFVAFARGDRPDGPPVDTPVDLYIGNQFVRTITAEASTDPSSWRDCPAVGHYAGRTCPFSFVKPIADYSGTIAYTADAPSHPCLPGGPDLPEGLSAYHAVTLAPDEDLDCTSYWAIQLFVNDVGQIVAANVVWAEP